jgi:hypothetical protein
MATITYWVEQIIKQKPFLQEALVRGLINNAALAESIIPEIEKKEKRKIKFSAVNMAIRRLSEALDKKFESKLKFDKHSDITIKSNLILLMVKRTWNSQRALKGLYELFDNRPGTFINVTQGPHEIVILTSDFHEKEIGGLFSKQDKIKEFSKLSGVTIRIPTNFSETPGFLYIISRALALDNINIVDVISTYTELTIILDERDTSRAFDVLRELINSHNQPLVDKF